MVVFPYVFIFAFNPFFESVKVRDKIGDEVLP